MWIWSNIVFIQIRLRVKSYPISNDISAKNLKEGRGGRFGVNIS